MIVWVFGGTGVGKKTFIRQMAEKTDFLPYWMEDGKTNFSQLIEIAQSQIPLIRWQWGREEILETITWIYPELSQGIYFLYTDPKEHIKRLVERGDIICTEEVLIDESSEVERLVERLSITLLIPYVRILV